MIPYGRQDITPEDIAAVEAVLRSDFLTQGPAVPGFEQALAAFCGVAHGVAVSHCDGALLPGAQRQHSVLGRCA